MRTLILVLALVLASAAPSPAQGLTRTKIFLQNPTSGTLNYSHKAGGDDWRKFNLRSGNTTSFTGIDPHWISFGNGRGRTVSYRLIAGSTNYFRWKNGTLDLLHR